MSPPRAEKPQYQTQAMTYQPPAQRQRDHSSTQDNRQRNVSSSPLNESQNTRYENFRHPQHNYMSDSTKANQFESRQEASHFGKENVQQEVNTS